MCLCVTTVLQAFYPALTRPGQKGREPVDPLGDLVDPRLHASRAHIGTRDREVKRASGDRSAAPICDGMHSGGCGGLSLPLAWALGAAATSAANIRASAMLFVTIIDSPPPSIVIRVGRYPRNARPMPEGRGGHGPGNPAWLQVSAWSGFVRGS